MNRPACYGLPICVSASSASCRACAASAGCIVQAGIALEQLTNHPATQRERLALSVTAQALARSPRGQGRGEPSRTVVASSRGVKRMTLTEQELARLRALPERVATQVRRLMERGWFDFARREIQAGRNPGDKGWKRVLCQALIDGRTTREQLQLALVDQCGLTPASAKVQASIGLAVFAAGGLCREVNGALRLSAN